MALKDTIEGLSGAQKRIFNQNCISKIYDESTPMISLSDQLEAEECAVEVDNLSNNDLSDLNNTLSSARKLSGRPC